MVGWRAGHVKECLGVAGRQEAGGMLFHFVYIPAGLNMTVTYDITCYLGLH